MFGRSVYDSGDEDDGLGPKYRQGKLLPDGLVLRKAIYGSEFREHGRTELDALAPNAPGTRDGARARVASGLHLDG